MDFVELEAIEGLRWSWNSWPSSKADQAALVIPLSVMCTPLMQQAELPLLPYDPVTCSQCGAVLNPYARVDYTSRIWFCSLCLHKNPFPHSYSNIGDTNLPAELFPTYSAVEYARTAPSPAPAHNWPNGGLSSSSSLSSMVSSSPNSGSDDSRGIRPAFVLVVDVATPRDELAALKNELLLVLEQLPETALVSECASRRSAEERILGYFCLQWQLGYMLLLFAVTPSTLSAATAWTTTSILILFFRTTTLAEIMDKGEFTGICVFKDVVNVRTVENQNTDYMQMIHCIRCHTLLGWTVQEFQKGCYSLIMDNVRFFDGTEFQNAESGLPVQEAWPEDDDEVPPFFFF